MPAIVYALIESKRKCANQLALPNDYSLLVRSVLPD